MRRLILTVIVPDDSDSRREWHHLTVASNEIAALGRDINILSETLKAPEPKPVMTEESLYKAQLAISDAGFDDSAVRRIIEGFKNHGVIVVEP